MAAKLAVDRLVEESEIAVVFGQFETNPDRPYMLWFQRPFLADDAALVSGRAKCANGG